MDRILVQPSFIPIYDALIKCRGILEWNIRCGLLDGLRSFSPELADDSEFICKIITSSTAVIDYGYRSFQLLDAMPHYRKKSQGFKSLSDRSVQLKSCRNYLQHVRGDLQGGATVDFPVLGSVSWIDDGKCHAMALSQMTGQYSFGTIAYDTLDKKWAWNVMVSCKSHVVYPEEILSLIDSCIGEVREVVTIEGDPYKSGCLGSLQALYCNVISPNNSLAEQGAQLDAFGAVKL